ncbi:MAG TPA: glycoside hydrolase family 32 protein [Solirubrobacterales bacterium]|nr:glycoside hydrolase family 32 protein [Solirubrobacterales bacterium]
MNTTDEALRPIAHIAPARGWINDPNAPIWAGGRYHIYYQYNPTAAEHRDIRWGHATSTDLVHWQEEPVAIEPSSEIDRDGIFSGTAVADGDTVVAYYSAFCRDRRFQPVMRAVSEDGGYSFGPAVQVVAEPDEVIGSVEYRDPFVWREGSTWRMLVGTQLADHRGAALAYQSADGIEWSYDGVYASADAQTIQIPWGVDSGSMWECPQHLLVDGTRALIASAFRRGTEDMRAFGLIDQGTGDDFVIGGAAYLDQGPDFFAAYVFPAPDGRVLLWGWARDSLRVPSPITGWAGALAFPRELRLRADGQLGSWPLAELEQLRAGEARTVAAGEAAVPVPHAFELRATVPLGAHPSTRITLDLGAEDGAIRIIVDAANRAVTVDPEGGYSAARIDLPALEEDEVELRWFVDGSISEVFVSGGYVATHRFYAPHDPQWRVGIDGAPDLQAEVWGLETGFNDRERHR